MAARDRHQHDLVADLQLADAVDHAAVDHLPARHRFAGDFLERFLRHAGIVLEGHRHLADDADEARKGSSAAVS